MLTVSNLSIHFAGRTLFDNVAFAVKEKERIGLIGRNGNGKSTLLKIICGLQTPEKGTVSIPNNYDIGYLPQDGGSNSEKTVFEETASALREIQELEEKINHINDELLRRTDYESDEYSDLIHHLTDANERFDILGGGSSEAEIEQVLTGLGFLRTEFDKKVSEFSGGWQMRIELAKILLRKPDCILLDEPTNHLDIESIFWLEDFLKNYFGSILIVSHDKRFLDNVTNRTIEISNGKIYDAKFAYSAFIESRKLFKEQQTAAKKNQDKQIAQTERFIERFKSKATFASRAQSKQKMLDKVERIEIDDDDISSIRFRFPESPRSGRLVAETKNLYKKYDVKMVLNGIDFAIERGERVAFVGKNGEGKSTFSKILAGVESYDGDLTFGHNMQLGYYAQHQAHLLQDDLTVFDVIEQAAKGDMRSKIRSLLGAFLFSGDSVYKKVKVLSGGEKSRLSLAKLLLEPINFLVMDEPTNHLDMMAKEVLKNALLDYEGAMVIVSHDREFLEGLTNKTVEFKNGQIKEYPGDIKEFLEIQKMNSLAELEMKKSKQNIQVKAPQTSNQEKVESKNFQKEKTRVEKLIKECELEISQLEKLIERFETMFAEPNFFSDIPKSTKAQSEYKEIKSNLDKIIGLWTKYQEELEIIIING